MGLPHIILLKLNVFPSKAALTQTMPGNKMEMGFIFILTCMCVIAPVQAPPPRPSIARLSYRNMDFAMNLYREIASFHDKNIFFSPLSISTTFAALLLASDGVTHQQILKGINLEQLQQADQPELIPKLFQLLHENITRNGTVTLNQGLTVFMWSQFQMEKTFEDQLKTFFDADIKSINFSDTKASMDSINEFIKQKTRDKVTDMLSDLDAMTRVMLISTIFFQGAWEMPFNSNLTQNAPFYIDNYSVVEVPMMYIDDKFYMAQDQQLGAELLKLPYREGVSMLIVLPNKGVDYTVIDDEITASRFRHWTRNLFQARLDVNIPKFKMTESYPLHKILPGMGISSVFSNSANLTKMSRNGGIKLSEVVHKAVIEVDETGTIAAAATSSGIIPYSLPKTFIVNRPFFFFIYHEDTNCILFMGRVIDPTKN